MTAINFPTVSLRALSRLTGLDRDFIIRRIEGIAPAGTRSGHPVYSLSAVLPALCRPAAAVDGGEVDPDSLTPTDRKAWYDSELRRRQLQLTDRELIPASELERCLAVAFAALAKSIRSIPDNLERRTGCSPEIAEAVERMLDAELEGLADRLATLAPVTA